MSGKESESQALGVFIGQTQLKAVIYVMIAMTSVFTAARTFARYYKFRKLQIEDFFVYLGLTFFLAMSIMYLIVISTMYHAVDVAAGRQPLYKDMMEDAVYVLHFLFAITIFFWATLWSIKFSLLFLFRKLMVGLPVYMRWWWAVATFTFVTFWGCFVSEFTSCSSLKGWFTPGGCGTKNDLVRKNASLYYSLAVDLITDILIMALPVRLLWKLQISRAEKISVAGIFGVGIISMLFAIVRVVSITAKTGTGTASPSWLALWAAVEGCAVIVVGCLPAFAVILRNSTPRPSGYGYSGQSKDSRRMRTESIPLENNNNKIVVTNTIQSSTKPALNGAYDEEDYAASTTRIIRA